MTVKERVLALRLLEKQRKKPVIAKELGIEIKVENKPEKKVESNV